jgi:hypothetical protein
VKKTTTPVNLKAAAGSSFLGYDKTKAARAGAVIPRARLAKTGGGQPRDARGAHAMHPTWHATSVWALIFWGSVSSSGNKKDLYARQDRGSTRAPPSVLRPPLAAFGLENLPTAGRRPAVVPPAPSYCSYSQKNSSEFSRCCRRP